MIGIPQLHKNNDWYNYKQWLILYNYKQW